MNVYWKLCDLDIRCSNSQCAIVAKETLIIERIETTAAQEFNKNRLIRFGLRVSKKAQS